MTWETVIGLEVHVQLKTKSKIFSGAATAYGAEPNTQTDLIDLGYPGTLPVLNRAAVEMAVKFGLAVNAKVQSPSVFARKNYFYPDLPKGYQISQFELPIVAGGTIIIRTEGNSRIINLTRAHLEEDAGKSLHEDFAGKSGIDLNRAGTPLLEIVSEPEMRSAEEAVAYLKALHALVCYLDICDGNLQEGSFRCDANVSVRHIGAAQFGTRCEIKNINSFKFVKDAIEYERDRQIAVLEAGGTISQETRLYDSDKNETRTMRKKVDANDYRYFPDPDLLPLVLEPDMIARIRAELPELPDKKRERFIAQYNLTAYEADILIGKQALAAFYEQVVAYAPGSEKIAANWILGDLLGALNQASLAFEKTPISVEQIGQLLQRIVDQTISGKIAKQVFEIMWTKGGMPDQIIADQGLVQVTDSTQIEALVMQVIADNPAQVAEYRAGKVRAFGFFVGLIMKASQGKANPQQVNVILKQKLDHAD